MSFNKKVFCLLVAIVLLSYSETNQNFNQNKLAEFGNNSNYLEIYSKWSSFEEKENLGLFNLIFFFIILIFICICICGLVCIKNF